MITTLGSRGEVPSPIHKEVQNINPSYLKTLKQLVGFTKKIGNDLSVYGMQFVF
jgi:hypothetical protein